MIKLQQFMCPKFTSSRLFDSDYNIKRSLNDLRRKGELVALADSQCLRTIRKIRYSRDFDGIKYSAAELKEIKTELNSLSKNVRPENRPRIKELHKMVDEMLYCPEYITVVIQQSGHYKHIIKNGFYFNGHKYVRLLCGASQARVNTVGFIREDFEKELKEHLRNGITEDKRGYFLKAYNDPDEPCFKITKNKYNAYFALASTATYLVTEPNCVVIDDCEVEAVKKVDWVEDLGEVGELENKNKIITQEVNLGFNYFDGGGLIDITLARQWAEDLELDYIPSVFIVRNVFIKGCLFVVDFHKFAKEVAHKDMILDMYGVSHNIRNKNLILTKSMFKVWNAYDSIETYQDMCHKYENYWGVSRVAPKADNDCITTNYQFCQVFNLDDDDVENLCGPTVEWLTGVGGLDRNQALLFMMGKLAENKYQDVKKDVFDKISDPIVKALIVNPDMINDEYIRQVLIRAINKKIKESFIGKLIVEGNFSTMIPDPYAMMEWAFADGDTSRIHGLLKENEHYSNYWNKKGKTNAIAMRSPLTWRSEAVKLNLIKNKDTEEWYQYINSGIIYNIFGNDCMLHADSDYDGDIVCTTCNETMLKCKFYDEFNDLPITYEKKTTNKEYIKEKDLWKADVKSFNSTIGTVTNYSTSFYDLLCKYKDKNDPYSIKCYEEILERLKITRFEQGNAIDKAKGVQCDDYPKHWVTRQIIYEDDDDEVKDRKKFLNDVCGDRKPYFFYYRYKACKNDYDEFIETEKKLASYVSDRKMDEIIKNPTKQEMAFVEDYNNCVPLIDFDSPMNKICHYMENHLKEISLNGIPHTPESVVALMMTGKATEEQVALIKEKYKQYSERKRIIKTNNLDTNIDQFAKQIRRELLTEFNNTEEIANAVVQLFYVDRYSQGKGFAWNVFGNYILNNIIKNSRDRGITPSIPLLYGNSPLNDKKTNYLFKEFGEVEFEL